MLKRILATLPLCSLAGCGLFIDALAPKNDAAAVDAAMDAMVADAGLDAFAPHDAVPDASTRLDARMNLDGHMPDVFVAPDTFVPPDAFVPVVPDAFASRDAYTPPDSFVLDAYVSADARVLAEICNGIDDDSDGLVDEEGCAVGGVLCIGHALNGHAYILCDTDVSFDQADMYCRASGFHMVKIETAEENDFVVSLAMTLDWMRAGRALWTAPRLWIGVRNRATLARPATDWRWADGSVLATSFWHSGEPGGGLVETCGEMRGWGVAPFDYGWNDSLCVGTRAYLCENDTP